jgi:hypothetical protein
MPPQLDFDDPPYFPSRCCHWPCRCDDIDTAALLGRNEEICRENAKLRCRLDAARADRDRAIAAVRALTALLRVRLL